ncbi:glycosyltransferase family 4 protein [Paraglaciecola arctica]|uniref:glycosyltransferase family 4 protein n=1 Tax=Paraglaciecola arctica TaxID=1128911 RepID=UPI001C0685B9|nr:glycosyltransferase family 4 protein [Paraglaciecola arctica]MBU3004316.1 glycosyltransferase family 4 protein [Paraglaciecola arctica]
MNKKVLVLTENFPPISGGSGRWFWELYSRLPKDEYLILADDVQGAAEFDDTHQLNITRMPLKSAEWGLKSFKGIKFYWRLIKRIRKIIKQQHITHIHCGRVIHEGVTAWLLKLLTGTPYLCYVHGEDVETAATSGEHNLMVKQVCKHAERLICNSQNSANIVKRLKYAKDDKIDVLHPGVDATLFVPITEDKDFKQQMGWQGRKVIITVGRLQERKGQDMMIRATALLKQQFPEVLYAIIGRGDRLESLKALAAELGINDHVQFLTEVTDPQMIQCYQQCDVFILPNRTIGNDIEGFGMVLVEAQACGKPVIAGDSGGTRETMVINESGFVIDCTDVELISSTVTRLLVDPEHSAQMGKIGRKHVESELDWQAHVQKASLLFSQ